MVVLNQAKRLELLEKLVAIPSVNDHEQAVAQFLHIYLAIWDQLAVSSSSSRSRLFSCPNRDWDTLSSTCGTLRCGCCHG